MSDDKVIRAGTAGLLGILVDQALEWGAVLFKFTDSMTSHMLAMIIYSSHQLSTGQVIIGEIAHLIAGFVLGIVPYGFYRWSGKSYPIVKGAGIGAGMWLNHSVLIPCFVDPRIHLVPTTATLIVELIGIVAWGIVSYAAIVRWDSPASQRSG
jgi:hypothetical protein